MGGRGEGESEKAGSRCRSNRTCGFGDFCSGGLDVLSREDSHSSQGAVVVAGVPRVPTSADLTVCSRCVVDAAVAVASLRVADLWHGARVGVPITVAGHTHACGFK